MEENACTAEITIYIYIIDQLGRACDGDQIDYSSGTRVLES